MKIITALKHIIKVIFKREKIYFIPYKNENVIDIFDLNTQNLAQKNNNKYQYIIGIDGIGFSGSSAVTDFLAEFSTCTVFGGVDMRENPERGIMNTYEVDVFRDPYGILDLEKICYTNVTRIRNKAINDFINLTIQNYRGSCPLYDDYYLFETQKFLNNILDYTIPLFEKQKSYIPKRLSISEYRKYANNYISSFLGNIESKKNLVLDNFLSIGEPNSKIFNDYFGNYKLIYVYSDPRDIYARARLQPGNDWVPVDKELFLKFYTREFPLFIKNTDKNILCVSFDEFCNDYDKVATKIMQFLDLKETEHINKFKYFDPKKSINNTKVYTKIENQEVINYIYNNLKQYCWENIK